MENSTHESAIDPNYWLNYQADVLNRKGDQIISLTVKLEIATMSLLMIGSANLMSDHPIPEITHMVQTAIEKTNVSQAFKVDSNEQN